MRILLALCAVCLTFAAHAAVYRCDVAGKKVYTDHPCVAGAKPHELPAIGVMPAGEQADLAREHDARLQRRLGSKRKEDAVWLKTHEKRRAVDARMTAAVVGHKVLKGMSAGQVRRALGAPDEVHRKDGVEKWVYLNGKQRRTVVLENGEVSNAGGAKTK